jgi:hypothetical protein
MERDRRSISTIEARLARVFLPVVCGIQTFIISTRDESGQAFGRNSGNESEYSQMGIIDVETWKNEKSNLFTGSPSRNEI